MKKLIFLSFLFCSIGFANNTKNSNQLALEAYNFLRGLDAKELGYTQHQLYKQGISRLKELVRKLNFVSFPGEEIFTFDRDSKCNEYRQVMIKNNAKQNAMYTCRQDLPDGYECIPHNEVINLNEIGRCHAKAVVHRVKTL